MTLRQGNRLRFCHIITRIGAKAARFLRVVRRENTHSALRRGLKPTHDLDQCALAASAWAQQAGEPAGAEMMREMVERNDFRGFLTPDLSHAIDNNVHPSASPEIRCKHAARCAGVLSRPSLVARALLRRPAICRHQSVRARSCLWFRRTPFTGFAARRRSRSCRLRRGPAFPWRWRRQCPTSPSAFPPVRQQAS